MRLCIYVARTHEERGLEKRMVERMEQCAAHAAQGEYAVRGGASVHSGTQPDEYYSDVLYARICQQPFDVLLQGRQNRAPKSCRGTDGQQNEAYGVQFGMYVGKYADYAVDARFNHHARHYGRDMGGRRRMRFRQPYVKRKYARLHAETYEENRKEGIGAVRGEVPFHAAQRDVASSTCEGCEPRDEQHETYVHHHQIVYGGTARRGLVGVEHDEHERTDCHQLPEEQEPVAVLLADYGHHRKAHRGQRRIVEREVGCGFFVGIVRQITARVERDCYRSYRYYYQKQGAQTVYRRRSRERISCNRAHRRSQGVKRACADYRCGIMRLAFRRNGEYPDGNQCENKKCHLFELLVHQ